MRVSARSWPHARRFGILIETEWGFEVGFYFWRWSLYFAHGRRPQ